MLESGSETHFKALQSERLHDTCTPSATLHLGAGMPWAECSGDGQLTAPPVV